MPRPDPGKRRELYNRVLFKGVVIHNETKHGDHVGGLLVQLQGRKRLVLLPKSRLPWGWREHWRETGELWIPKWIVRKERLK